MYANLVLINTILMNMAFWSKGLRIRPPTLGVVASIAAVTFVVWWNIDMRKHIMINMVMTLVFYMEPREVEMLHLYNQINPCMWMLVEYLRSHGG